jgi:hypothetical protein
LQGARGTLAADGREVLRAGPKLPKLPACCIVAQIWIDRDLNRVIIGVVKTELMKRQRQTHAARFDIGLFERPVFEKSGSGSLFRAAGSRS